MGTLWPYAGDWTKSINVTAAVKWATNVEKEYYCECEKIGHRGDNTKCTKYRELVRFEKAKRSTRVHEDPKIYTGT